MTKFAPVAAILAPMAVDSVPAFAQTRAVGGGVEQEDRHEAQVAETQPVNADR